MTRLSSISGVPTNNLLSEEEGADLGDFQLNYNLNNNNNKTPNEEISNTNERSLEDSEEFYSDDDYPPNLKEKRKQSISEVSFRVNMEEFQNDQSSTNEDLENEENLTPFERSFHSTIPQPQTQEFFQDKTVPCDNLEDEKKFLEKIKEKLIHFMQKEGFVADSETVKLLIQGETRTFSLTDLERNACTMEEDTQDFLVLELAKKLFASFKGVDENKIKEFVEAIKKRRVNPNGEKLTPKVYKIYYCYDYAVIDLDHSKLAIEK